MNKEIPGKSFFCSSKNLQKKKKDLIIFFEKCREILR